MTYETSILFDIEDRHNPFFDNEGWATRSPRMKYDGIRYDDKTGILTFDERVWNIQDESESKVSGVLAFSKRQEDPNPFLVVVPLNRIIFSRIVEIRTSEG